jgi:protein-S-isoprenylcysteine O-methyltransferase Ste14
MTALTIGSLGFACLFVYDINSVKWNNKILHYSFAVGVFCVVSATALIVGRDQAALASLTASRFAGIILAALFLAALVYTLFFALPFRSTYLCDDEPKTVCDRGVYAFCRHPGFWCFSGLYASLYLIRPNGQVAAMALVFICLNFLYILMQDRWTFPSTLLAYESYRLSTPFIIPNRRSLRRGLRTIKVSPGECHESEG